MPIPEEQAVLTAGEPAGRFNDADRAPLPFPWYARLKFDLLRALVGGWARLVGLRGAYLLGRASGTIEYYLMHSTRRRYLQRLREAFGDSKPARELRRHTRDYFRRVRCDKLFYLLLDRLPREKILRRVRIPGHEHIDAAAAAGRGAYVAMSHHGAQHVGGMLMALAGYQVTGVRDRKESALRRYIQSVFEASFPEVHGFKFVFADAFPRQLYRAFRNAEVVSSALDVNRPRGPRLRSEAVTLFGERREVLTGTPVIALRCGAIIVQGFVISRPNFYYRIVFEPLQLDPVAPEEIDAAVTRIMRQYAANIERHVHEHPDHISRL